MDALFVGFFTTYSHTYSGGTKTLALYYARRYITPIAAKRSDGCQVIEPRTACSSNVACLHGKTGSGVVQPERWTKAKAEQVPGLSVQG